MLKLLLLTFLASTLIISAGCEKVSPESPSEQDWVYDEILAQLQVLRRETIELKDKLKKVESKLDSHLKGARRAKPNKVSIENIEVLGSDSAEFSIIEFSDFQCPYCARHDKQVFPELKKKYIDTGKLQYMARDYPLGFHKQAPAAAMAAHCAGDQDQYWPMRHRLFAGGSLNSKRFKKDALALDLNMDDFNECMQTNKYAQRVENDLVYGDKAGVDGTPRFYIGRIKDDQLIDVIPLSGAQPFSAFERVIKQVMNKKS